VVDSNPITSDTINLINNKSRYEADLRRSAGDHDPQEFLIFLKIILKK